MEALLLLIAAFVVYRFATRKSRAEKKRDHAARKAAQRQAEQWAREDATVDVSSSMRVIVESTDIARKTKNIETAHSRYNVAMDMLYELLQQYPHRTDWQEMLAALIVEKHQILLKKLSETIDRQIEKASLAKTLSPKINALTKAAAILADAARSDEYDAEWITSKQQEIFALMHQTELGKLVEAAEKHEFKADWKKALGAYQDVLFFLKKDDIPDEEQAELFAWVDQKISAMKEHLGGGANTMLVQ